VRCIDSGVLALGVAPEATYATCGNCGRRVRLTADRRIPRHTDGTGRCPTCLSSTTHDHVLHDAADLLGSTR